MYAAISHFHSASDQCECFASIASHPANGTFRINIPHSLFTFVKESAMVLHILLMWSNLSWTVSSLWPVTEIMYFKSCSS